MKINHISHVILVLSVGGLLPSCDSGPLPTSAELLDSEADSLTNLLAGDLLEYTSLVDLTAATFPSNFTFGSNRTAQPNSLYSYSKSGKNTFSVTATNNAVLNLQRSLDVALRNAPINSDIRRILNGFDRTISDADLRLLVNTFLNPFGASLFINPDDSSQIISAANIRYIHNIDTSNRELIEDGLMGGEYNIISSGLVLNFRQATSGDQARYRLNTRDFKIPQISNTSTPEDVREKGRYILRITSPDRVQIQ